LSVVRTWIIQFRAKYLIMPAFLFEYTANLSIISVSCFMSIC